MENAVWVGPRAPPQQLVEMLAELQTTLLYYPDAATALAALQGHEVAVAIVTGVEEAARLIEQLNTARPDMQVLLATDSGIPRHVVLGLWSGASGLLEFKSQSKNEIVLEIQEWVGRHKKLRGERDLLLRLHRLNEDFLRTIVSSEARNIELEEKLDARKRPLAPEEGPTQILIVDDEQVVHDLLKKILWRHEITSALDGEAAMRALYEKGFHVVITDKNLPGMSGLEVMKHVKELSPETDVVMITAFASKESAVLSMNLGASAYLEKPFADINQVRERIDQVIDNRRRQQKSQRYLSLIKERNAEFLGRYKALRGELDQWMKRHTGSVLAAPVAQTEQAAAPPTAQVQDEKK